MGSRANADTMLPDAMTCIMLKPEPMSMHGRLFASFHLS
jgi:hypothetical protein